MLISGAYLGHTWVICHITGFGIYPAHICHICIQCGSSPTATIRSRCTRLNPRPSSTANHPSSTLHLLQLILSSRRAQVGTVGGASNVFFDAGDQGEPPHPQEGSLAACWSCCIRQWDRPSRFFCLYGHVWACPSFFVCREERVVRTIAPRLGGPWGGVGPWEPFWRVPDAQGTRRKPYNSRQLVADPAS